MNTILSTVILLTTCSWAFAQDLTQTAVTYETNPGTNKITYNPQGSEKGLFLLTLTPTTAFGGGTQESKGWYTIQKKGEWIDIQHKTTQNIIFTIRIKAEDANKLSSAKTQIQGDVFDAKGTPAEAGGLPLTFKKERASAPRPRPTPNQRQGQSRNPTPTPPPGSITFD